MAITPPVLPHLPDDLPADPLELVHSWLGEAERARIATPNAMVLATVDAHGAPSARVVLCKEIRIRPGFITFFSNYSSRKGRDLDQHPRAAAVLYWDALHRQVRLEGPVTRASAADSDAYFASRPWQARIGAWASQQSTPVASRAELAQSVEEAARRFRVPSPLSSREADPDPGVLIPRPPHWGGYHLWADAVELWLEGTARLHDRARWERTLKPTPSGFDPGPWRGTRLHP